MPTFVTYLELRMGPESAPPSKIVESLKALGWRPVFGRYDFGYSWNGNWNTPGNGGGQEFWKQINDAHTALQSLNVTWSFRTFEQGREDFYVRWSE